MLSNNFAICKIILNKYNIVFNVQFLSYCQAGQAGALVTIWCQLLTLQVGTVLKTPQMLTGKRKWPD